jgi:hypothetical protein
MLWTLIINFAVIPINIIIGLFPNADSSVVTTLSGIGSSLKTTLLSINSMFPITELFQIIGIIMGLYILKISVKIIRWMISFIPGVNA